MGARGGIDLPQFPYRTPLVDSKGIINEEIWQKNFNAMQQMVNQRVTPILVANLPNKPVIGMSIPVTDSTTVTWGATVTGGGTHNVLAFWNGANWTVMGA